MPGILDFSDLESRSPKKESKYGVLDFSDLASGTARQEAGQVIEPRSLIPKKEDIPELLAGTAAGIAMAGRKTPISAAAVGGASMVGEIGKQAGQALGYFKGNPPSTFKEAALRDAAAFGRGAIGEVGGNIVGKYGGKLIEKMGILRPFSKSVSQQAIQAGERAGIKLSPAMVSSNPYIQGTERLAESAPFLGHRVTQQRNKALEGLKNLSDKVFTGLGELKSSLDLSFNVENRVKHLEKAFNAAKNESYDKVMHIVGGLPPQTNNTLNTINDIIARNEGELAPAALSKLEALKRDLMVREIKSTDILMGKQEFKGNVDTLAKLRNKRSQIGALVGEGFGDPSLTGIKKEMKSVYAAMSQDMDDTIKAYNPQLGEQVKEADKFFSNGLKKFEQATTKQISRVAKDNPDQLVNVIFKVKRPEWINRAREVVGDETFSDLRVKWFDDILDNSINSETNFISPQKLSNNLEKYRTVFDEIFKDNPQSLSQINDLISVSKAISKSKPITAGSQTSLIELVGSTLNSLRTIPVNLAYTTNKGARALTSGLNPPVKTIQRTVQPLLQREMQRRQ